MNRKLNGNLNKLKYEREENQSFRFFFLHRILDTINVEMEKEKYMNFQYSFQIFANKYWMIGNWIIIRI